MGRGWIHSEGPANFGVPIVFHTDQGPNMNMHIHKQEFSFHGPRNPSPPLFIHLFIMSLHLIFNSKWGVRHMKGYCVTPLKVLQWQKKKKIIITSLAYVILWLVLGDYFWRLNMCGLIPRGESQWALERQKYLTTQFFMRSIWYYFPWTCLCS